MQKNIAVFAGNGCKKEFESYYLSIAYKTGKLLVENGYTVVTGGGPGLMNETLRGAYESNGNTIGVILDKEGKKQSSYIKELFKFKDLKPRQQKIMELSHGFIAVPGGIGTLYEMIEIIALKRVGEINLKTPLIAIDPYFNGLNHYFETMIGKGFIDESLRNMITFSDTPEDAIKILRSSNTLPA